MSDINIKVDQSIIRTNLTNMIVHPNEKAIVNLIAGILESNHHASKIFIEYLLGKSEVILPIVGTVGKFKISSIWISDKALLENSEYNLNGYVTCIVTEQLGLHDYNQLKVDFPTVDSNGKKITASTGLELKQFLIDDNDFGDLPF